MKEYTNINAVDFCCIDIYPGSRKYGVRKLKIDDLYNAIKSESDGLWIIKSTGHTV